MVGSGVSFDPAKDIPDLTGKVILVTGGNSGLGAETIKQLAKHNPAEIWLAARTRKTADDVVAEVKQSVPSANITILELDLTSFESIKASAAKFLESATRLDILFLNAGIAFTAPGTTKEGYELQFGTNHMGHALFTKLLLPLLLETAAKESSSDVRIVVVSSAGHSFASSGVNFDVLKTENTEQSARARYGVSKLANIYFTQELAKRYPAIKTVAIHPGTIATPIVRGITNAHPWTSLPINLLVGLLFKDVQTGAKNQLWASVAEKAESGAYYDPVGKPGRMTEYAKNKETATKLWEWTEGELAKHGSPGWP